MSSVQDKAQTPTERYRYFYHLRQRMTPCSFYGNRQNRLLNIFCWLAGRFSRTILHFTQDPTSGAFLYRMKGVLKYPSDKSVASQFIQQVYTVVVWPPLRVHLLARPCAVQWSHEQNNWRCTSYRSLGLWWVLPICGQIAFPLFQAWIYLPTVGVDPAMSSQFCFWLIWIRYNRNFF